MPTSTATTGAASPDTTPDPLAGVDHIIVIDNGAHNIRIASIPYPFPPSLLSDTPIDPSLLASSINIDVFPNAIARTRTPHTLPSGSKTSIFVSSHIHTQLDDYAALHLRLPQQSGIVVDWQAQKTIWDHVLTEHLGKLEGEGKKKGKLLAGKAVIVTEAYANLEHSQHATDLLLFEHYGAQAVWRATPADLVGLGTDVFRPDRPTSPAVEEGARPILPAEEDVSASPIRRPSRAAASSTEPSTSVPRLIQSSRPESMLVLDLGYSFCHAIPLIRGQPHYPSIRRLELGGKMLVNLLKETLSFQQLDMMDESWLMSHIFSRTSFVAARVGSRVYGGDGKVEQEFRRIQATEPAEWSYEDLLLMQKFAGRKGKGGRIGLTWSLPDYGGRAGREGRDRARYGYIAEGPDPAPYRSGQRGEGEDRQHKRPKLDPEEALLEWESSFIAASPQHHSNPAKQPRATSSDDEEEAEEKEDLQTLHLSSERFSMLEHLFNPSSLGLDQKALPDLVLDSITHLCSSSPSLKSAGEMMWSNIVLVGGLSNAPGMRRRLMHELRPLAPADVPLRIYPEVAGRGMVNASMIAIKAGVAYACEVSAKEAIARGRGGVAGGAKKAGKKGKGRPSRAAAEVDEVGNGRERGGERWLTYAQWMNPGSGSNGSDSDIVKAANKVFYPPLARLDESRQREST